MNTFEQIHIQGFRRLLDAKIKLNPLNVLIGANGSGKTSILDVFSLLAKSAAGKLNESLSEQNGIDANLSNLTAARGGKAQSLSFELSMPVPNSNPIEYRLAIKPTGASYQIADEQLSQQGDLSGSGSRSGSGAGHGSGSDSGSHIVAQHDNVAYYEWKQAKKGLVRPNWEYNSKESALSQVPKMFREPEEFRKRLASSTHYHVLDVGRRAPIRLPQQMRDATLPGPDGEDIVSCLYTVRETDPDRFELIEATLRAGFPDFERLNFPPVAAGTLAMTWKDRNSKHPFYMHQLSEGTLRFLWLVTLLQSPGLTEVTIIDEPEVSLHPELLSLLADLLRDASNRTQLIVATHADRLVRFLQPSEILTINTRDDGASEVIRVDDLDLENWLKEYSMDEVWRMCRIGGRV